MPVGALEHLHDGEIAVGLQHQAVPRSRPLPSRIVANSSQPTPATPRTTSSGPRNSVTPVYSRCAHSVMPVAVPAVPAAAGLVGRAARGQLPRRASIACPLAATASAGGRVLLRPQQRREVLLLERGRPGRRRSASSWQRSATASTASASAAARPVSQ